MLKANPAYIIDKMTFFVKQSLKNVILSFIFR
jgi:hypothetical protein